MRLLDGPYKDKDQDHMDPWFRVFFEKEAEEGGFLRGKESFLVVGDGATENCLIAGACLQRGQYYAYPTYAPQMLRLIDGKYVPYEPGGDGELDYFNSVECVLLYDFFDPTAANCLEDKDVINLTSLIKTLVLEGVVFVIACDEEDPDLDLIYGKTLGEFIEQHFTLIKREDNGKGTKNKSGKNSRDAASRGGS